LREFRNEMGWLEPSTTVEADGQWARYDQWVWERVEAARTDLATEGLEGGLAEALAEQVIESHLGRDWYDRHITGAASSELTKAYLLAGYDAPIVRVLAAHRTHELGRRLYEMQSFDWFEDLVADLRTRNLTGASFELDVLWLLLAASPRVVVRRRQGRKGEDFDLTAVVMGMPAEGVPVEVKAKADTTQYTDAGAARTAKKAAQQLPRGKKGLLFVRVPTGWVSPRLEESYADALAEGTRQTSRIGAVVSIIDKPHLTAGRRGRVTRHLHLFAHPDCPRPLFDFVRALKDFHEQGLTGMAPTAPF